MDIVKQIITSLRLRDIAGVFLVAVLPLIIFLKHSGYSLYAPEILVILSLVLGFAGVCGLVMAVGRAPARVIIFTWLAVLVVDVQTDWITTLGLRLLLNLVLFGALFWLLRRHLTRLMVVAGGLMVLVTAVMPGETRVIRDGEPGPRAGDNRDLPFVLHLILDEQGGVEGIPLEFDPQREAADRLRDFYVNQSFAVYGRAYSRYGNTRESITNMMNFSASDSAGHFLGEDFRRGDVFENNPWFDLLHDQGYRIHVLESDYMAFFDPGSGGSEGSHPFGDTRLTYATSTIKPIENADLTVSQKIPFILSTYFTRSYFLKMAGAAYSDMAFSDGGARLGIPRWDLHGNYPGALATMQVLDIFEEQLGQAGPGQAFFAHVLLPHSPYGFDRDCRMELQPGRWLLSSDKSIPPRLNTPESRALRYPLYLDQMFCLQSRLDSMFQVLKDKGLWEEALIIIHGDHGTRISLWPPIPDRKADLSATDYMDYFSTLFAVKGSGIRGGYHRQLLPLDYLFTRIFRDGLPPGDPDLEDHPHVFLQDMDKLMEKQSMPPFAHGRPLSGDF